MDSPRSDKAEVETRISTPSNLDDHRFQPTSLPRAGTFNRAFLAARARRETFRSQFESDVMDHAMDGLDGQGARAHGDHDAEQAAVDDDDTSVKGSVRFPRVDGIVESPVAGSISLARRPTLHRNRASSRSSHSTSPPNSVDAFADPRRRDRTNTLDSKAASEYELRVQRTISGGTHRRRPTFSEDQLNAAEAAIPCASKRESVEADVCFPPPLEVVSDEHMIDFEALEEFVAQSRSTLAQGTPTQSPHGSRHDLEALVNRTATLPGSIGRRTVQAPVPPVDAGLRGADEKEVDAYSLKKCASLPEPKVIESNRFSFFSSELDSTIHAPALGDLVMPHESFRELFELNPDGGVWWLDVLNATEEELAALAKAFGIHPLTSEDIATQENREKVELFRQYYFVCFRSFQQMDKNSEQYMDPLNVYIVVFRKGVLSFTFSPSPHAASVRRRISKLRDYVSLSSDWVCYALIDDIVDSFGPVIHDIERETDVIEDQVFVARADDSNPLLRQIGVCRRKVMGLMRLLGGKADVIKGFAKRCNEQYSVTPRAEIGLYLGDVQDHVVTMMSNLGHFEKMLSRSHSNYLAQISMEGIKQGNHTNDVLSRITVIATILVPLNVICGLFGMNVPVPGGGTTGLGVWFGILGSIIFVVVSCLIVAKKKKYI